MRSFTSPLDNIHVASPCSANWEEMFGDDRKRFCGDCKLNVYNLSDMTRQDAENLIVSSEGRLCVRFFRRADGTVLTKNCPVGWAKVKQRVSRVGTAAFSMIAGLFGGVFAFSVFREQPRTTTMGEMVVTEPIEVKGDVAPQTVGISVTTKTVGEVDPNGDRGIYMNGQMTMGKMRIDDHPNTLKRVERLEPRRK
ncbi:hypothetical protein BH10ACI2_BH10ACI2_01370 [soil metagenome]